MRMGWNGEARGGAEEEGCIQEGVARGRVKRD